MAEFFDNILRKIGTNYQSNWRCQPQTKNSEEFHYLLTVDFRTSHFLYSLDCAFNLFCHISFRHYLDTLVYLYNKFVDFLVFLIIRYLGIVWKTLHAHQDRVYSVKYLHVPKMPFECFWSKFLWILHTLYWILDVIIKIFFEKIYLW